MSMDGRDKQIDTLVMIFQALKLAEYARKGFHRNSRTYIFTEPTNESRPPMITAGYFVGSAQTVIRVQHGDGYSTGMLVDTFQPETMGISMTEQYAGQVFHEALKTVVPYAVEIDSEKYAEWRTQALGKA